MSFGTSYEAALYRLRNTKFLSEGSFDHLYQRKGEAREIVQRLKIEEGRHLSSFALSFTGMAIEAYRRDKITYNKLIALADQVAFNAKVIDQILFSMGLENNLEAEVYLPE